MRTILSVFFASTAILLSAQSNHPAKANESKDLNVIYGSAVDTSAIYRTFIENAPKLFNVPGAPRFAIVGKDEKFYFGIGGFLKTTVSYDFPNPISSGMFFTTSSIPMHNTPGNNGQLLINAQQSNLFFNVVALPGTKNQIGFYFNFDLCGDNYTPYVQYAYLTYRGFLVGYNTSLYLDGAACAPAIDKEGPNSLTYALNEVVDYTHKFQNGLQLAIGAELGPTSFTTNNYSSKVNQRIPDIPAYIQYNFKNNPNSYIRFSAIMKNMQYRNLVSDKTSNVTGWGVKASGTVTAGKFITYYQVGYGKGVTGYFEDLGGLGLELTPDPAVNGKLQSVPAWGGYFGLQYNFSSKCFASVTYSHLRNYAEKYSSDDDPTTSWDSQYKYGQYMAANIFYNITPQLTWGLEWDWGRRVNFSGLSRHDNRIQTMIQFNF